MDFTSLSVCDEQVYLKFVHILVEGEGFEICNLLHGQFFWSRCPLYAF